MRTRYESTASTYIIAEIGLNHNGDLNEAKNLITEAVRAGSDAVKFQVRDLESLYTKAVLDDPLKAEQGTQYILSELHRAHLTYDQIRELREFASQYEVDFFATPFDLKSAEFLNTLGIPIFKIGSPDFTNLPLLDRVAAFGKPMILSTGMCDEGEIRQVVSFLKKRNADFALLHCNSTYPASYTDINLRYLPVLKQLSGVRVGYSGHEQGFAPTLASLALGAEIIERHITSDTTQQGPDHRSSLTVADFAAMVREVRNVEMSLGRAQKNFSQGERINRTTLGKSLVAARDLARGSRITANDLVAKSPAKGVAPLELERFVGQRLNRDLKKDDYVFFEDLAGEELEAPTYSIPRKWGVVGRLNDFQEFLDVRPKLVEIHLTWRDLVGFEKAPERKFTQDLVVHAPEYFQDHLIDFTTTDPRVLEYSFEMLNRTIALAREMAPRFSGMQDPQGPRVVVHPGGHFTQRTHTNKQEQYRNLVRNLKSVDSSGVQILVENMPPFPWYFGGQWYNTVFMDAREIAQFAQELGWGICYDTSHALLYCNSLESSLKDYTRAVLPHVKYLHISDAKGVTDEGLQLGHGNLDFDHLFELIHKLDVGFIPEIWQGHLNRGQGFKQALATIEKLLHEKLAGDSCHAQHAAGGHAHTTPQ